MLRFSKNKDKEKDPQVLLDYVVEEREINGQVIKVKVYPSSADKYIDSWRSRREAYPSVLFYDTLIKIKTEE